MRVFQGSLLAMCLIAVTANPVDNPALRAVSDGNAQFSSAFFQAVAEQEKGNLITSPLSASLVLAMTAYGAAGETEKVMKEVLHLPQSDDLGKSGYQNLIDSLNDVTDVTLNIANKAYVNKNLKVKQPYQELTQNYFRSAAQSMDFTQSTSAAKTINDWVKENTANRIQEIVKADDLTDLTALILVNAIYFKGQWKTKFNKDFTTDKPFHIAADAVKNVPTMFQKGEFKFANHPELGAKVLEIPYKNEQFSMLLILPDDIDGLDAVEQKLKDKNIPDLMKSGNVQNVEVYLPKFRIETKIDLEQPLTKLGLGSIFTNNADFSGMADTDLHVSKVVQKAFIEVNEEGSEAAGATETDIESRMLKIYKKFKALHPFLYSIVYASGTPYSQALFTGRVALPETS